MNCANCWSLAGLAAVPVILHGQRDQRFHGQRIADAVHLHVVAVVDRVGRAGAHGDDLADAWRPRRRCSRSASVGSVGTRAVGGHHGDRHFDGDQADVVARETIHGVRIGRRRLRYRPRRSEPERARGSSGYRTSRALSK